ncbi:unnamed protein product [Durusdinium trenchii]|uniref:Uncharacterized protein n=1 Tax=Durusdinium trenchii TaxID=1381693 RepID=A0ABP0QZ01_9DINO
MSLWCPGQLPRLVVPRAEGVSNLGHAPPRRPVRDVSANRSSRHLANLLPAVLWRKSGRWLRACRAQRGAEEPRKVNIYKDVQPAQPEPAQPAPGGVIEDVVYVFVNSKEDKAEAMSDDVLDRVNTVTRAHQGLYKVPEGVPDTEHGVGAITGALTSFPAEHVFQVVGKTPSDAEREEFLIEVKGAVQAHTAELREEGLSVQSRMGGRYTSVQIRQTIHLAEQINAVLGALKSLPKVVMCF